MPAPTPAAAPVPPTLAPESRLAAIPEFAAFYGKLKSQYPRDYAVMLQQVAAREVPTDGNTAIWDAMRDLQQSQGILAAKAGPQALDGYFAARQSLIDSLAPLNPHDCVDFLYGLANPSLAAFTEAHHGLVATLAERQIAAIDDGRSHPADRVTPTDADLDALAVALAARKLDQGEIALMIDGTLPDSPLADARLCEVGRLYLDALRSLPGDIRQRLYGLAAELLARS